MIGEQGLVAASPALLVAGIFLAICIVVMLRVPVAALLLMIPLVILSSILGMAFEQSVSRYAWGPGPLLLPLKWAVVGLFGGLFLLVCTARKSELRSRLSFGILSGVIFAGLLWSVITEPARAREDRQFWNAVFSTHDASLPLEEYKKHLSPSARADLQYRLGQDRQVSPGLLKVLAKIMPQGLGVVRDQERIDQELFDALLAESKSNPGYLVELASNPAVPDPILRSLVSDPGNSVREGVARNKGASVETLEASIADTLARQATAKYHYKEIERLLSVARSTLARHSQVSPARLSELAKDESDYVRAGVASNPKAPGEILRELSNDSERWVRDNAERTLKEIGLSPSKR